VNVRRYIGGLAAIGLLVAAGCGGDDGGDGDSAEGGGGGSTEDFCAGFNDINEQFADINPAEDPEALDEAVALLRDLDPPEEVADDYATVLEGFEALADIDVSDQDAVAELQEQFSGTEDAFTAVSEFVDREC
jgi:hypothetical protein